MAAKDTKIYMVVDTEKIRNGNENECVEFKDNRNNLKPSKDARNFTSIINAGHKIFWYGEPKENARATIEILDIEKKSNQDPEFLKTKGNDPSRRGTFMAQVIGEFKDGEEGYNVIFEIKDKKGQFRVDPKLKMEILK